MNHDAGHEMKTRMRADLRSAMKEGRSSEASVIRALVAAIDNAEAPPLGSGHGASSQHRFREGSAEVERLCLDAGQVRDILLAEIEEREHAAIQMDDLAQRDRANVLRAEAAVAKRYVD